MTARVPTNHSAEKSALVVDDTTKYVLRRLHANLSSQPSIEISEDAGLSYIYSINTMIVYLMGLLVVQTLILATPKRAWISRCGYWMRHRWKWKSTCAGLYPKPCRYNMHA